MNIKTIIENIEYLANEDMTEHGIHHDDWSDRKREYALEIIVSLMDNWDIEEIKR